MDDQVSPKSISDAKNCEVCEQGVTADTHNFMFGTYSCESCQTFIKSMLTLVDNNQNDSELSRLECELSNVGQCIIRHKTSDKVRSKCKACWLNSCIRQYNLPLEKKRQLLSMIPLKTKIGCNTNKNSKLLPNENEINDQNSTKIEHNLSASNDNSLDFETHDTDMPNTESSCALNDFENNNNGNYLELMELDDQEKYNVVNGIKGETLEDNKHFISTDNLVIDYTTDNTRIDEFNCRVNTGKSQERNNSIYYIARKARNKAFLKKSEEQSIFDDEITSDAIGSERKRLVYEISENHHGYANHEGNKSPPLVLASNVKIECEDFDNQPEEFANFSSPLPQVPTNNSSESILISEVKSEPGVAVSSNGGGRQKRQAAINFMERMKKFGAHGANHTEYDFLEITGVHFSNSFNDSLASNADDALNSSKQAIGQNGVISNLVCKICNNVTKRVISKCDTEMCKSCYTFLHRAESESTKRSGFNPRYDCKLFNGKLGVCGMHVPGEFQTTNYPAKHRCKACWLAVYIKKCKMTFEKKQILTELLPKSMRASVLKSLPLNELEEPLNKIISVIEDRNNSVTDEKKTVVLLKHGGPWTSLIIQKLKERKTLNYGVVPKIES